jgi:hypothetical protein
MSPAVTANLRIVRNPFLGTRPARATDTPEERLTTMHAFETIDTLELVTVTGGAEGDPPTPNTNREQTTANGNLGVTYKGTQVGLQGGYSSETVKTDPAQCAQDVRRAGGSPTDILKCYGK